MDNTLVTFCDNLCKENNATLLYLTKFGSELYGTSIQNTSDQDLKGLFLPNIDTLITLDYKDTIKYTTGSQETKNTNKDIDIELWSIQKFIKFLLPNGNIGAIDLLFSLSNKNAVMYIHPAIIDIFINPSKYFYEKSIISTCQYSINQAKKYGLKGTRLGILKNIVKYINEIKSIDNIYNTTKLISHKQNILEDNYDKNYCYENENKDGIYILGKCHMYSISFSEFCNRIEKQYKTFGERVILAEKNKGIDFKALSHAMRALTQIEEFYKNGTITFPLKNKEYIKEIKEGKYTWDILDDKLHNKIIDIKQGLNSNNKIINPDINKTIKTIYNIEKYCKNNIAENTIKDSDYFEIFIIKSILNRLEIDNKINIIYASESGSRLWKIDDEESDFDVRFVYHYSEKQYCDPFLNKTEQISKTIKLPSGKIVDIVGWELSFYLKKYLSGNGSTFEWICTHRNENYIYINKNNFKHTMQNLYSYINIKNLYLHYCGLQKKFFNMSTNENNFTLKNFCYLLRATIMKYLFENCNDILFNVSMISFLSEYQEKNLLKRNIFSILNDICYTFLIYILPYKKIYKCSSSNLNTFKIENNEIEYFINKLSTFIKNNLETNNETILNLKNKYSINNSGQEKIKEIFNSILKENKNAITISTER